MSNPKIKLKSLRKEHRLSQQNVATKLGMSRKNYCYIELGLANLNVDHAKVLKELYGVDCIDDLLEDEPCAQAV